MNKVIIVFATLMWALLFWGGYYLDNLWYFLFAGVAQWVAGCMFERILSEYRS